MLSRGGRYSQQLLVRGRKANPLLAVPALVNAREAVLAEVQATRGVKHYLQRNA